MSARGYRLSTIRGAVTGFFIFSSFFSFLPHGRVDEVVFLTFETIRALNYG